MSVPASEILGMVGGSDIGYVISTTLKNIAKQLDIPEVPFTVTTCLERFN